MSNYKLVATLGAILFGGLFIGMLVSPGAVITSWGVSSTAEAEFVERRLGASFLGFAIMCVLSRNLPASAARRAIALGFATALLVVAGFGIYELARGFAGPQIRVAIAIELAFAAGFIATGRRSG